MIQWFNNLGYPVQALLATLFTWFITLLGASVVFLFKKINVLRETFKLLRVPGQYLRSDRFCPQDHRKYGSVQLEFPQRQAARRSSVCEWK